MAPITEIATHKTIIDAAIKAGVKRIILSEFGTNVPELQTTQPLAEVYKGKVEIRNYMESKVGEGLTWTGLVVGAFFDWYVLLYETRLQKILKDSFHVGASKMGF